MLHPDALNALLTPTPGDGAGPERSSKGGHYFSLAALGASYL